MKDIYRLFLVCLVFMSWGFARAESDERDDNQRLPDQEVYQLEPISVTPGRFSISEGALSPYVIPKTEMEKRKIPDPSQLINDYLASYAKWQKLLDKIDRNDLAQLTALIKKELYDKIDANTYGM